jgi:hypothetical protein
MVLCKVEFNESELGYRTLGDLRRVNFDDKQMFIDYLTHRLGALTESYISDPISKITFSYIIRDGLATDNRRLLQDLCNKTTAVHRFNNMNLPITMNPEEYGEILLDNYIQLMGERLHRFIVENGTRIYKIDISNDSLINKVRIQGPIDLEWVDTKISDDTFKREIGKSVFYFMGGEKIVRKKLLNAKPFRKLSTDKVLNTNFITLDIETITLNSKITPYLLCAYNGSEFITSYANELLNQKELFSSFINKLLTFFTKGSNTITIYAHNLSGFDGIFLMKHLLSFGKVEPLLFNSKLMSIKVKLNIDGYKGKTIVFKDSYLLLPLSLRQLCLAFNISNPKGIFPFNFTDIFYKGILPKLEYWTGITQNEYELLHREYSELTWSFKEEAIKYCKLDCQSLHEVIVKFNELIFKEFKVNIHQSLTLPSLAMRIYKVHFMPANSIYQIDNEIEQAIRQSYSGGAVDVYIPHNRKSTLSKQLTKLFYYDVNSLYPTVMANMPMPFGKPVAFEGNIRLVEPDAFGVFYCNITSPALLEHPILQRKIKGRGTVAALGSWTGWISSVEMDNAMKFGYTFEILKGYEFETGDLFSGYVNKMYSLREEYPKPHAMNLIAKLLLNSLYGKFGMKMERTIVDIFNLNLDADKLALRKLLDTVAESIQDHVELGNNKYLFVRTALSDIMNEDTFHGSDVNIAIASTITAGARVYMSAFKNNPSYNLYYSDTDSIVIDRQLDEKLIGSKLGQLKLEHTISKAIFLAPKVYGFIDVDGNEVIKIKGVTDEISSNIHINDFDHLLIQDANRVFSQHKWYKSLIGGNITITDVLYNLKVTSNKRNAVYVDEVFNSTEPLNYDDIIK